MQQHTCQKVDEDFSKQMWSKFKQIYINMYFNFICLGPAQLVAWTALPQGQCQLDEKIPFVLDTCEETFSGIDLLLNEVWDGLDGRREW